MARLGDIKICRSSSPRHNADFYPNADACKHKEHHNAEGYPNPFSPQNIQSCPTMIFGIVFCYRLFPWCVGIGNNGNQEWQT